MVDEIGIGSGLRYTCIQFVYFCKIVECVPYIVCYMFFTFAKCVSSENDLFVEIILLMR